VSKLVFVDDFTHDGQWVKDADNSRRCRFQYPSDETLQLAKGGKGFFDPKEAGLLCVATPLTTALTSTWWRIHGSASPWSLTKPPPATGWGSSVGRGPVATT